mgnify:CR=1 FL=1
MVQTQTPEAPLVSLEQHQDIRDMLEAQWAEGKFLCVGLDVALDEGEHGPMALYDKARAIVDATKDIAAMYINPTMHSMRGMAQRELDN